MSEEFEFFYRLFEQYGLPGVGVGALAYVAYQVKQLVKSLHVNPSLGTHLDDIQATLKTIESNTQHTDDRVEDIWGAVK